MKLDRIDIEILGLLQKNARLTNKEIAARVGLAPSSSYERVRRLWRGGAIKGFYAEVDPACMGVAIQALIAVRLNKHARDLVDKFWAHALSLPEVIAIYHLTGADDFLVHVAVRNSEHLRELALDAFTTREEVAHLETRLVFEARRTHRFPAYVEEE